MNTTAAEASASEHGMYFIGSFEYEIEGIRYPLAEDGNGDLFIYAPYQFGDWRPATNGRCIDL